MIFYQGKAEGKTKNQIETVTNLITKYKFTDEQAADAVGVPIDKVREIREETS